MALKCCLLGVVVLIVSACISIEPTASFDPASTSIALRSTDPPPIALWPSSDQTEGHRVATSMPVATRTPLPPDTGWIAIRPGLEYRELDVNWDDRSDRLRMARVDPAQVRFRVLYSPDRPRRVSDWINPARTLLAVNGGFFDPDHHALGLLISDGDVAGYAYDGFGGMFAVSGDSVKVRWNVTQPYVEGEPLAQARQNFPMLVLPGGKPNAEIDDNLQLAPRTIVGQDRSDRIVFVVSPGGAFTLTGLGQWLAASDLELDTALNLDGGTSTGLLVRDGHQLRGVDSWVNVPDVIVVEAR